jgi:hypothetical protein
VQYAQGVPSGLVLASSYVVCFADNAFAGCSSRSRSTAGMYYGTGRLTLAEKKSTVIILISCGMVYTTKIKTRAKWSMDQSTRTDPPPSLVTLSRVRATKYRRPRGCKVAIPPTGEGDVTNAEGDKIIASPVWRVTTRSKAGMLPTVKFPEKCFETWSHQAGLENRCMMATPQRSSKTEGTHVGSTKGEQHIHTRANRS